MVSQRHLSLQPLSKLYHAEKWRKIIKGVDEFYQFYCSRHKYFELVLAASSSVNFHYIKEFKS